MSRTASSEVHKGLAVLFVSQATKKGKDNDEIQFPLEERNVTLNESVWVIDYGASQVFGPGHPLNSDSPLAFDLESFVGDRFLHDHISVNLGPIHV